MSISRWDRIAEVEVELLAMGLTTRTAARIRVGSAEWRERWAYRFPRLLGWLNREAANDRALGPRPQETR